MVHAWIDGHPGMTRLAAVVLPLTAGALVYAVRDGFSQSTAAVLFALLVVVIAAAGDRIAGLLAALSSAVWFDFFCTTPYLSFAMTQRDDLELAFVMVVVGVCVTELALWGRREQAEAGRQAGFVDGVLELSTAAREHAAGDSSVLAHQIAAAITAVLGCERCTFAAGPFAGDDAIVGRDGSVRRLGRLVDTGDEGLPTDRLTVLPVVRGSDVLGAFQVTSATRRLRPSAPALRAAVLLSDQLAAALPAPARSTAAP